MSWRGVNFIRIGQRAVALEQVAEIDATRLPETGTLALRTTSGAQHYLTGNDAIEALMLLKPSLSEGQRLPWQKGRWALHNLIGHPGMQLLAWFGLPKLGVALHEATIPRYNVLKNQA